ncbi:conserved hypothetical protein [Rhodobacter ferrooxidans]|uniref:Phytase-like domain-containing protein n=1 Tax=Rhodobacter ferrooxidans TaxID=371731 RepID=C8RWS9_9RHOB|nr:conserved hypothetical protein [Rhodobacter sp. SW2]
MLALEGSATPQPPAGHIGSYTWTSDDRRFGGFSGIEILADGQSFTALSDHGGWISGRFRRDATGMIVGIDAGPVHRLKSDSEKPLSKGRTDSEGLALAPDGSFYVSLERKVRVLYYVTIGGFAENLPVHPDFARMKRNAALEALAVDANGWLYTLPEESSGAKKPFKIYRFRNGVWDQPFELPRTDRYLPVGMDFGPDGHLYLLERQFHGVGGFASRVRRFTVNSQGLSDAEVLLETPPGLHDNLEGLSVWRDAGGVLRLTMVSDDNFSFFQRTEIVEYRVPG